MYREESEEQQKIEDFYLPFGGHLDETNRWVILSNKIPWDKIESDYAKQFSSTGNGAPAKSIRMALGALIIKEKLQISDEEVVAQIKENPYLQYFTGLESYIEERPFDASLMVHFRKRLNGQIMQKANEILFREFQEKELKKNRKIRKKLKNGKS
ncbi:MULTISPECIES: transposase [unclassified Oceanispirochaeta]|uniref:transposase n=1 Tax=unclassified Oceanispirochaeta TaxID=2635722 RepID=UPI000E09AB6A|nr:MULTISPECIES: transposase [unclassified Oceanispirochaeta]MBF9019044.1 transposase [Oceanispirochaeta sp. M2]NPD75545.1 transposase [Oceanispirochaeta sp. M1]RDG28595.1 transposase [Oceanispirochaeta sp. M1]